jgi:UDP-N-acetylglucosamine 2-epimerase (non-hydrolysing)
MEPRRNSSADRSRAAEPIRAVVALGTRPEAVKLAPVLLDLKKHPEQFQVKLVVTAQHREIMDEVLTTFGIVPDEDLDIMTANQQPAYVAARALADLDRALERHAPDILLVEGDTVSCLAASLAAFYRRIPVGHVEAGLRTYDRFNPFPEEVNRRLTAVVADLHFAPTRLAAERLLGEGIQPESVFVTGNTVIDALHMALERAGGALELPERFERVLSEGARLVLVTAHRRENWGQPIRNICAAIRGLVSSFPDIVVLYCVHPNPVVRDAVSEELAGLKRAHVADFPGYLSFLALMQRAYVILTDSGGIQEEAPSLGKPVLVLREKTERPEGIEAGVARLCGTDTGQIVREASLILGDEGEYRAMARPVSPYGDGRAAQRIRQAMLYHFGRLQHRPQEFSS